MTDNPEAFTMQGRDHKGRICVHSDRGDLPVVRCPLCGVHVFSDDPVLQLFPKLGKLGDLEEKGRCR